MNLYSLCKKIDKCDYPPLPADIYTDKVHILEWKSKFVCTYMEVIFWLYYHMLVDVPTSSNRGVNCLEVIFQYK